MGDELQATSDLIRDLAAISSTLEKRGELRRQEINELAEVSNHPSEQELTAILRTMQVYGLVKTTGYKWYIPD